MSVIIVGLCSSVGSTDAQNVNCRELLSFVADNDRY